MTFEYFLESRQTHDDHGEKTARLNKSRYDDDVDDDDGGDDDGGMVVEVMVMMVVMMTEAW